MDTRVAGHQDRRPFISSLLGALDSRRFRIRAVHVKGSPVWGEVLLHRKKFFVLKHCFVFLILLPGERRYLEAAMAMGVLFTVTTLISIALMIAAYRQSDDGGSV
jgi:hypothetical protein